MHERPSSVRTLAVFDGFCILLVHAPHGLKNVWPTTNAKYEKSAALECGPTNVLECAGLKSMAWFADASIVPRGNAVPEPSSLVRPKKSAPGTYETPVTLLATARPLDARGLTSPTSTLATSPLAKMYRLKSASWSSVATRGVPIHVRVPMVESWPIEVAECAKSMYTSAMLTPAANVIVIALPAG